MAKRQAKGIPLLTACLITRNEETHLAKCLTSLEGVADEIIVVDTGSTDRTRSIAAQAGAKVGSFAWCDDFAEARNAALKLATGKWVLSIDADEWIASDRVRTFIRDSVQKDRSEAYIIVQVDADTQKRYVASPRLFPREGAFWKYRIHEQIQFKNKAIRIQSNVDFWVAHAPRKESIKDGIPHADRNLAILDRAIEESVPGSDEYIHASIFRRRSLRPPFDADAIAKLEEAALWSVSSDYLNHQLLTYKLYRFLIEENRFEEMLAINDRLMAAKAHGPLIYFALAIRFVGLNRPDEARLAFRRAMAERDYLDIRRTLAPMFSNLQKELFG